MKILKGRGIEDIAHYTLLGIAFYFSYQFTKDMLLGFMIMLLVFEIMKPNLMNEGLQKIKTLQGKLYVSLSSITILLSLLATCSVLINNYSKMLDEMLNNEYKSYTKLFQYFSDITGVETITITIFIFFIFAILLEVGIVVTKTISVTARQKRLGEYQKTFVEQFEEYQESLVKGNFNLLMNQIKSQQEANNILLNDNKNISLSNNNMFENKTISAKEDKNTLIDGVKDENINFKKDMLLGNENTDLANKNNDTDNVNKPNNIIDINKVKVNINKNQFQSKELSEENVNKYLEYATENIKEDGSILGIKKISDSIGITQGEGQRIYRYLLDCGKLKKINNFKTKVVEEC